MLGRDTEGGFAESRHCGPMIIHASGAIPRREPRYAEVVTARGGGFADEGRRRLRPFAWHSAIGSNQGVIVSHRGSKGALWLLAVTISVLARAPVPGDFS